MIPIINLEVILILMLQGWEKVKTVLLIVNDDYLKSEVCMQEALIVHNNHDNDGRVFFCDSFGAK